MHRQLTRAIKIMWVRILTPPLQAQGLFHRHFSKHKYAYDALGLLPGNSQGEEKEVSKRRYVYIIEGQGFKGAPWYPSKHRAQVNSSHCFSHLRPGIRVWEQYKCKSGQRSNESDGTKEGEWTMGQDKREKRGEYGHKVEQMRWLKEPFLCNDDKVEQTSSAPPLTPDHLSGCKNQPRIGTLGPP